MGLCLCGCGQETLIATGKRTHTAAGEPMPYVRGHWARGRRTKLPPPNPSGICQCGCGQPAPRAKLTIEKFGHVEGEFQRYIRGHVAKRRARLGILPGQYAVAELGHDTPCWVWLGVPERNGYCRTGRRLVHRKAYEQFVGPIPDGLVIDHLCCNRACINPAHLEPVTPAENNRRTHARQQTV